MFLQLLIVDQQGQHLAEIDFRFEDEDIFVQPPMILPFAWTGSKWNVTSTHHGIHQWQEQLQIQSLPWLES